MTTKAILTDARYVQDVRDEFHFSSLQGFGGNAAQGDRVQVVSRQTGNLLAIGEIIEEGKPYEECRTVKVTQRFE